MIDTTTTVELAVALSKLRLMIFPCRPEQEVWANGKVAEAKSPRTINGLYAATDDEATIREWWRVFPDSLIGVAAGASGLVFLDGDIKGDGANAKDFETSLFVAGITPDPTWEYITKSGGKHYAYAAPSGIPLNGQTNYRGLLGCDRRGGASYAIWWDDKAPESREAFAPAPEWLLDPVVESDGSSQFEGDVDDWLNAHLGTASPLLRHIMENDFTEPGAGEYEHDSTLKLVVRIVALGATGESGATEVLDALRSRYLDGGYEDYSSEWDGMLSWAIKNVGGSANAPVPAPREPVTFLEAQAKLPDDFDITTITAERPLNESLDALSSHGLTEDELLVILRNTPTGRTMGDDELMAEILTHEPATKTEKVTKPVQLTDKPQRVSILTVEQRKQAKRHWERSWLGEYEQWTRGSFPIYNAPYHRAAAWMTLANMLGECAYLNIQDRDVPLNLYFMVLGPTTTGKSQAQNAMQNVIHYGMSGNNPDLGDNFSKSALGQKLRTRNNKSSMLNADEADGLLAAMREKGNWHSELMSYFTYLYDGKVPPQHRAGDVEGEWMQTVFSAFVMGTEVAVVAQLDRKMFLTGFLARFQWFIGESVDVPQELLGVRFGTKERMKKSTDMVAQWGSRFAAVRENWNFRSAATLGTGGRDHIWPDSDATAKFLHKVTSKMEKTLFVGHPNADILTPSLTRMDIAITKMAALMALSAGRESFSMDDVLVALYEAESMLGNLEHIASKVASSEHSKTLDELEGYILGKGQAKLPEVLREWSRRGYDGRATEGLLGELFNQKRVNKFRTSDGSSYWYEIKREG